MSRSRSDAPLPDSRLADSRVAGLGDVRRWLILLLLTEAWLFAALAGLTAWARLPVTDRLLLGAGAGCLVLGWSLHRRTAGLWFAAAAPLCLIAATLLNTGQAGLPAWIALAVSTGHVTYAVVLLTPPKTGLAAIAGGAALLVLAWGRRPTNVVPGALEVLGGWVSMVSLILSALALWFAWHALLRQALTDDARMGRLMSRIQDELATQERSRLWRSTVVSVHETLLSTLRYILQTDSLDRAGLALLPVAGTARSDEPSPADLAEEVRQATASRIAAGIVTIDSSAVDLPVDDAVRAATRAAIVECALNAVLHGAATDVSVSASFTDGRAHVAVSDNGAGVGANASPGLGWTATLTEGLGAVGGSWSIHRAGDRTVVVIAVPTLPAESHARFAEDGFEQGRLLITAPLTAIGVVGTIYDVLVAAGSLTGWILLADVLAATFVTVWIVARRTRPRTLVSLATIAALAAIPWLMTLVTPTVGGAAVAAALTTAGYTLIAVAVWSPWWQGAIGLLAWAVGVVAVAGADGGGRPLPIIVALVNCLVIVPVAVIVSRIGARRYRRAREALAVERDAINRQSIRASSALLIDQHLSACVAQAQGIIDQLAEGAPLDDDLRRRIQCLEGLIRATIQVDPLTGGEFSRVAAQLVSEAFGDSIPVRVGPFLSSTDQTPLDREFVRRLDQAARLHPLVTVRTLSDGISDYLTVELAHAPDAAEWRELRQLAPERVGIDITNDPDGTDIVMITRPIAFG